MTDIQTALFALRDPAYQAFQSKLIPTIDPQTVIGVRMPALRKLAREIAGTPVAEGFLQELPHRYYEENNLHGLLISAIPDYDGAVAALETFLPYVDNWATCDLLSPKAFRKHPPELRKQIRRWVEDAHTYTVRFGLGMLMSFYLDEGFQMEDLDRWTHNKTIQKAVESYRITPEQKDELRSLRWKDCAKEEGV